MDLNNLKADGLLALQGEPICVKFLANEGEIRGNICTIDPITRSIVLAVFGQNDSNGPEKLVIVPGGSYSSVERCDSTASQKSEGWAQNSEELRQRLRASLFTEKSWRQIKTEDTSMDIDHREDSEKVEAQARYERIIAALKKASLPFKEENEEHRGEKNKVIVIGAVRIMPPYKETPECIVSANKVALKRIMNFLEGTTK
ncbi:hypothetical protein Ddc_17492 [Ditylenchus destructor]|nr:hypothetical protein Ddc_17492 [Ditylenchus destructor]